MKRHTVVQPLDQSYRFIPLTQGKTATVDAADYDWLSQWFWFARRAVTTGSFYAFRAPNIAMHRIILAAKPGELCDHINHNTLDNRRCNLRKATYSQNAMNKKSRDGLKGVYQSRWGTSWAAQIRVNNKLLWLGSFSTKKEAAQRYNEAAKKYHGEFAHLNAIDS